ncbi:MAG TPA: hypothetical protein VFA03_04895 [Acetobacteraceae bacterium]|nr:hypothetical protein [Acetobacteraceae bacterium]
MARTSNASGLNGRHADAPTFAPDPGYHVAGISFSVPELMIMAGWAEYHGLRMVIELDTCVDGAAYEEVAAFYSPGLRLRRWSIWREPQAVVLERMSGPAVRAGGIEEILEQIIPASADL